MNDPRIGKVVFSEGTIKKRVEEIGKQISEDYKYKHPVVISVLKGAFYFMADLTRCLTIPINIDFLAISLYSGVSSHTGIVRITKDLDISITGRHVLIVEDVIGTGLTLGYLYQHIESLKPASVKICTLLDKSETRLVHLPVAYQGFSIPEKYVVGYGLDSNEEFRHLPYIAEYIEPDDEEK